VYHKPTACEVCFFLGFNACHMPVLNQKSCMFFFCFSFLVNGKGVDKRTNIAMVRPCYFFVGSHFFVFVLHFSLFLLLFDKLLMHFK
jgi:ABC-type transport system involved in cytochrome c biogenesis permease subunit